MTCPIRSAAACTSRSPTRAYRSVIVESACPSIRATVDKEVPRASCRGVPAPVSASSRRSRAAALAAFHDSGARERHKVHMRDNWLSNRVFNGCDDILDHRFQAWNNLVSQPARIASIGT